MKVQPSQGCQGSKSGPSQNYHIGSFLHLQHHHCSLSQTQYDHMHPQDLVETNWICSILWGSDAQNMENICHIQSQICESHQDNGYGPHQTTGRHCGHFCLVLAYPNPCFSARSYHRQDSGQFESISLPVRLVGSVFHHLGVFISALGHSSLYYGEKGTFGVQ